MVKKKPAKDLKQKILNNSISRKELLDIFDRVAQFQQERETKILLKKLNLPWRAPSSNESIKTNKIVIDESSRGFVARLAKERTESNQSKQV